MCIESVMPSNLCRPILFLALTFPRIRVFSKSWCFSRVGASHQVAKVLELQLQHQSFQSNYTHTHTPTHFCKTTNLICQQMGSGKSFYMKIFSEICPLNFKTGKRTHFLPTFYSQIYSITYLI